MRQGVQLDSPFVASNRFLRSDGTPFWSFLKRQHIAFDKKHFPFVTSHEVPRVKQVFDFDEYLSLSSKGEALAYLYQGLGKSLNYVGPVLDYELEHGFNDHTDRHTLWVSQTGNELLQRSGMSFNGAQNFDTHSELLMTLVGMLHDLGNFMGRKEHSTFSAWLMTRLFGNWYKHRQEWDAALFAVLFHEEPVLKDLGIRLEGGNPLQWALVAADKMHVGRDRVGGRSFESGLIKKAFEQDKHILLNALIVRSTWYLQENSFYWHLGFSVDQLEEKFGVFTKGNKRLWLPPMFQRLFERKGVAYRQTFARIFKTIYEDRIKMAAESVFLLYPFINTFSVLMADIDTRGKVGDDVLELWEQKRSGPTKMRQSKRPTQVGLKQRRAVDDNLRQPKVSEKELEHLVHWPWWRKG